jgi:hypothetical protein
MVKGSYPTPVSFYIACNCKYVKIVIIIIIIIIIIITTSTGNNLLSKHRFKNLLLSLKQGKYAYKITTLSARVSGFETTTSRQWRPPQTYNIKFLTVKKNNMATAT